jgi:ribosome-binding protein aMBF1 (putative translation factor)
LGIAERQIHVKFNQKQLQRKRSKPLPDNIQTIGDWIRTKRTEKNLTSGHVAFKMGIADSVVRSWEDGSSQPNSQQLKELTDILGPFEI